MKGPEPPAADLEAVFGECAKDLTAYFARRHGGTGAAEDLVQESFLQLARRLRSGQAVCSPRAYLFGIARNVSLAFFRKQRDAGEPLDSASDHAVSAPPDARLIAAREIIASLPAIQREILDLRFSHALSYTEIASVLGIPVGTVRSRLHHAIAILRQRLEADDSHRQPDAAPPKPTKSFQP